MGKTMYKRRKQTVYFTESKDNTFVYAKVYSTTGMSTIGVCRILIPQLFEEIH